MPFQFSTFKWETPRVPTQTDKDSCGVFCMKFLDEWEGGNTQMESFKDWSKMRKWEEWQGCKNYGFENWNLFHNIKRLKQLQKKLCGEGINFILWSNASKASMSNMICNLRLRTELVLMFFLG